MNVVVDASMLVEIIVAEDDRPGRWLLEALDGDDLYWVDGLTILEVASALRKLVGQDKVDGGQAAGGLRWLGAVVVKRQPIGQTELARIWEMRETVTAYDAAYLAVTERVQADSGGRAVFVTADAKLARSPAVRCPVMLYAGVT